MKNKIGDLRDHMFAALERLSDESLDKEQLAQEISRSQAIADVGKIIVESAKTELLYAKITNKKEDSPRKFLEEPDNEKQVQKIERPKAEYSNQSPE